jgi:hypothetical protein
LTGKKYKLGGWFMKIYVAGPFSARTVEGNIIEILGNMRRGLAVSVHLIKAGHAVFCPFLDFQFGLIADVSLDEFRRNSMEWVRVSDAMLLLDGWRHSVGCRAEQIEASLHGVPTFENIDDLLRYGETLNSYNKDDLNV